MVKKRALLTANNKRLVTDPKASGETKRGHGVRSLCPCHAGWEVFEQRVSFVMRALRDPNRAVRADALHVFEDAAVMQFAEDLRYYLEPGEERIGEKRARLRSMADRLVARRDRRRIKKRKRRYRTAGDAT